LLLTSCGCGCEYMPCLFLNSAKWHSFGEALFPDLPIRLFADSPIRSFAVNVGLKKTTQAKWVPSLTRPVALFQRCFRFPVATT
jgi:hypothetical protein